MKLLQRLLLLLLSVNVLLMLWSVVRQPADERPAVSSFGLVAPLFHIDEISSPVPVSDPVDAGEAAQSRFSCLMRGPFVSDSDAGIAMLGSGITFRVVSRPQPGPGAPLYRAMIAPSDSRELAQIRLSEVTAAIDRIGGGIDTYLVTSGPIANAVSLGLFSERSNALNVQSLLADEGVDVVIESEVRVEAGYWVVTNDGKAIDIIDERTGFPVFEAVPAELSENLCEMIAQAG